MTQSEPNPTAQASADHERRIEEADNRIIRAAKIVALRVQQWRNEVNLLKPLTHYVTTDVLAEVVVAVASRDALNALTTPAESLPEKVEEWEGWRVWQSRKGNMRFVCSPSGLYFYHGWSGWKRLTERDSAGFPLPGWIELHGPARLAILRTLPPEVRAEKGGKS